MKNETIDDFEQEHGGRYTYDQIEFWIYSAISTCILKMEKKNKTFIYIIVLCLFAGLCSGLTVGYLSIDSLSLELKLKNGTESEVRSVIKFS